MTVTICIGNGCHKKGSYGILQMARDFAQSSNAQAKRYDRFVEIKMAFCLGHCSSEGVTIAIDDQIICGVTPYNLPDIWERYIMHGITPPPLSQCI